MVRRFAVVALAVVMPACIEVHQPLYAGPPPSVPPPSATGQIGNRPFFPRAALMTRTNVPGNASKDGGPPFRTLRSDILILERPATCADVDPRSRDIPRQPGERSVHATIIGQGSWPFFPGATFDVYNGDYATMDFGVSFEIASGGNGALARGTVRIDSSSISQGQISVDWHAANRALPATGDLSGTIPFVVCP